MNGGAYMDFNELYKEGFKIIRWYKCDGCKFFNHIVCLKNNKEIVIKTWKGGENSGNIHYNYPSEKDVANQKVAHYLQLAESYVIRPREQIIDILSLIGIDSDFVQ